jgi:hypothetical protein
MFVPVINALSALGYIPFKMVMVLEVTSVLTGKLFLVFRGGSCICFVVV